MIPEEHLKPDRRWEIWKCYTHQEYLDRFFIPGKFHKDVPETIKEAYSTVERLISYSYFYYPLTEEVHSKMTRILEMAIRLRTEQMGITFTKKHTSLNQHIESLRGRAEVDGILVETLLKAKELRNAFAHPKGHMYSGPIGYTNVISLINLINRLFMAGDSFNILTESIKPLKEQIGSLGAGVMVYETISSRYLISAIHPLLTNRDKDKTLLMLDPILQSFPQSMEDFKSVHPFFVKLGNLRVNDTYLEGFDLFSGLPIKVCISLNTADQFALEKFQKEFSSSDPVVRGFYDADRNEIVYAYLDKFIYDEFWSESLPTS